MGRFVDLTGYTFGRWRVLNFSHSNHNKKACWVCECSCGIVRTVLSNNLVSGKSRSCGCYNSDVVVERNTIHGLSSSSEHMIWCSLLQRCTNPRHVRYADYGGRGITVCESWLKFENFYADMGPRPSKDRSLDRIDNDGPYCKENCRWATRKEQNNNTRANKLVTHGDLTMTISQWSVIYGVPSSVISYRLRNGWAVEESLTLPTRKVNHVRTK